MPSGCVLVVEDEPINLEMLVDNLREEGYQVVTAETGESAWQLIDADPARFDVIVLDRMMPDMDGIEILHRAKAHARLKNTPVIMQTGMGSDEDVIAGLKAGAFYYLTKPFSADTLLAIVSAAASDRHEQLALQQEAARVGASLACLQSAVFRFRTPHEVRAIAALAASAAPGAERAVLGLSELMLNAVEHGNLEIGYEEKTRLIDDLTLEDEIFRRLALPEHADKYAELEISRTPEMLSFVVRDCGPGFDWQHYLEMSPERAFHTHGRGIAMSRMLSFDLLEYRGRGNEVFAAVRVSL